MAEKEPDDDPGTAAFVPDFDDTGEDSVPFVPDFDDTGSQPVPLVAGETYTVIALIYFALSLPVARLVHLIERRQDVALQR